MNAMNQEAAGLQPMRSVTIRVYVSKHCQPCQEITAMIKAGKLIADGDVELIDIGTDKGFEKFVEEALARGDSGVPSAFKEGEQCRVGFDKEREFVILDCPSDHPSPEQG